MKQRRVGARSSRVASIAQALSYREREISKYLRLTRKAAFYLVTFLIITAGSIWLALQVAPMQTVSAAGQTAQVGAAIPSLSWSGPGELDLFGQVIPTKPQFEGPDPPAAATDPHHHRPAGRPAAPLR